MNDELDKEIDEYSLNYSQYSNVFKELKYNQEKEVSTSDYYNSRKIAWKNIKKILSSKKITEKLSDSEIENILNDIIEDIESKDLFDKIENIVQQIYGERAKGILEDRGDLSLDDIPNFDIFEDEIIDTIGLGGVHSFLTYYMKSEKVITEMVDNPELIPLYKEFEKMTDTYFPPSAIGLEDKLTAFYNYRELVNEVVEQGKQDELKDNLKLILRDEDIHLDEITQKRLNGFSFKVNEVNIEDLANYQELRKAKINEQISSSANIDSVKALIQFKFFGCLPNVAGQYNKYDHKKFLKDYLTFHHSEFSTNELDLIELYSIIEDIQDIDVFKKLNDELDKQEIVIDPVQMKSIDNKVVESYKKEYLESLLTVENAKEMVDDPNNKSYKVIIKPNGDVVYEDHVQKANGDIAYEDHIQKANGDIAYKDHIQKANGDIVYKDHIQTNKGNKYFYKNGYSKQLNDNGTVVYTHEGKNLYLDVSNAPRSAQNSLQNEKNAILKRTKGRGDVYNYRLNGSSDAFRIQENGMVTRISVNGNIENDNSPESERLKRILNVVNSRYTENNIVSPPEFNMEFFDPEMFKVEKGDVENFVLYGVETNKLMVSAIRGGATSTALQGKKLILSNSENGGTKFRSSEENRIYIEKNLEGGISTRSFYYKPDSTDFVGLAFTNIDANSIVGFFPSDAHTDHSLKSLRPYMSTNQVSDILDQEVGIVANAPEAVALRYEYDISKIVEGTKGGKLEPDYIVGNEKGEIDISKLRKWAVAFSKPIISLREIKKQDVISQDSVRTEREESDFMKKVKQIAEKRKSRDIQTVYKEIKESHIDKGKQEQDRDI